MDENLEEIHGNVEELVYRKPENGFTVLELSCDDEYITVVGVLPEVNVGEELKLRGKWSVHQTFGRQFKAELCERSLPSTAADLYRYLASGAIKGIGPKLRRELLSASATMHSRFLKSIRSHLRLLTAFLLQRPRSFARLLTSNFPFVRS